MTATAGSATLDFCWTTGSSIWTTTETNTCSSCNSTRRTRFSRRRKTCLATKTTSALTARSPKCKKTTLIKCFRTCGLSSGTATWWCWRRRKCATKSSGCSRILRVTQTTPSLATKPKIYRSSPSKTNGACFHASSPSAKKTCSIIRKRSQRTRRRCVRTTRAKHHYLLISEIACCSGWARKRSSTGSLG